MQKLVAVQLNLIREVDARGLAIKDGATGTRSLTRRRCRW
jgi:hypothetical protein